MKPVQPSTGGSGRRGSVKQLGDAERIGRIAGQQPGDHVGGQGGFAQFAQAKGQAFAGLEKRLVRRQAIGKLAFGAGTIRAPLQPISKA